MRIVHDEADDLATVTRSVRKGPHGLTITAVFS